MEVNRKKQEEDCFCPGGGTMVLGKLSLGWGRAKESSRMWPQALLLFAYGTYRMPGTKYFVKY